MEGHPFQKFSDRGPNSFHRQVNLINLGDRNKIWLKVLNAGNTRNIWTAQLLRERTN